MGEAAELASLWREASQEGGTGGAGPPVLVRSSNHAAATREVLKGENLRGLFQRCAAELRDLSEGQRPGRRGPAMKGGAKAPLWARQVSGRAVVECSELAPPVLKHLGADRREQWLAGLAAGQPLVQLSEAVPHGFGKGALVEALVSARTPPLSAAWFVKVTLSRSKEGAGRGERAGPGKAPVAVKTPQEYTAEWESLVRTFLLGMPPRELDQLRWVLHYGGEAGRAGRGLFSGRGGQNPPQGGLAAISPRVLYIARLLGCHMREGLLQKLPLNSGGQLREIGPVATPVYTSESARVLRHGARTLQRLDPGRGVMQLWGLNWDPGAPLPEGGCEICLVRTPWSSNVAVQVGNGGGVPAEARHSLHREVVHAQFAPRGMISSTHPRSASGSLSGV